MRRMRTIPGSLPPCLFVLAILAQGALGAAPRAAARSVEIIADEMCCAGCARKVTGQLYTAKGVRSVEADLATRTLRVSLTAGGASLGELWAAVERAEGGPTQLKTAEATYTLKRTDNAKAERAPPLAIAVETMHCKSCAQRIASNLYALKGVTKVSVTLSNKTLYVESVKPVSPWAAIDAVLRAQDRPLAVAGPHGELLVQWKTDGSAAPQHHAMNPQLGGTHR